MVAKAPVVKPKPLPRLPTLDTYPIGATVLLDTTAPPSYAGQHVTVRAYSSAERQILAELYPGRDQWLPVGFIWGYTKLPEQPIAPLERKVLLYVPARAAPPDEPMPVKALPPPTAPPETRTPVLRFTPAEIEDLPIPTKEPDPMPTETILPSVHPFVAQEMFIDTRIDPLTKAEQMHSWITEASVTKEKAAFALDTSQATIGNYLALLNAPDDLKAQLRAGTMKMHAALKQMRYAKASPDPDPAPPAPPPLTPPVAPSIAAIAAELATIPQTPAPLTIISDDVHALRRELQTIKRDMAALLDNLVESSTALAPAPITPPGIVIHITVGSGGVVTIQQ